MVEQTNRLHQQIARLRGKFITDLPEKRDRLMTLWRDVERSWSPDPMMDLHFLVHGLKGTAGTFGYRALSEMMATLDEHLTRCQGASRAQVLGPLTILMNGARAAISHVLSDPRVPAPPTHIKTLLLGGGDSLARSLAGRMLRSFGLQVTEATDLSDGSVHSQAMKPDGLVLLRDLNPQKQQEWCAALEIDPVFVEDETGVDGVARQIMARTIPPISQPWHLFILSPDDNVQVLGLRDAVEAAGGVAHAIRDRGSAAAHLCLVEPDLIVGDPRDGIDWVKDRQVYPLGHEFDAMIRQAEVQADLNRRAACEPITGTLTGAGMRSYLARKLWEVSASNIALAVLRVEGFNDIVAPGSVRDLLLRRLAVLLRLRLRPTPIVAYLGDGIFCVWQTGQTPEGMGELLDRAARGFTHLAFVEGVSYPVHLSVAARNIGHEFLKTGDWPSIAQYILADGGGCDGQASSDRRI